MKNTHPANASGRDLQVSPYIKEKLTVEKVGELSEPNNICVFYRTN